MVPKVVKDLSVYISHIKVMWPFSELYNVLVRVWHISQYGRWEVTLFCSGCKYYCWGCKQNDTLSRIYMGNSDDSTGSVLKLPKGGIKESCQISVVVKLWTSTRGVLGSIPGWDIFRWYQGKRSLGTSQCEGWGWN